MNDANYLVMAKIGEASDKTAKKFAELMSTVLDTEVPQSEVKQLKLGDGAKESPEGSEDADEGSEPEPQAGGAAYLVKVTTK